MKPTIREQKTFDFYTCPSVPTYEAGYLVGGNGDWRSERPVVTPRSLHGLPAVLPVLSRRRHLAA